MRRCYGRDDAFGSVINKEWRKDRDVFSNSTSSSFDSSSEVVAPRKAAAKGGSRVKKALTDVSNVPRAVAKAKPKGKRAGKSTKNNVIPENIPDFDSLENFELVVQPVTPIQTHVSISMPTTDDNWDIHPTQDILAELQQHGQLPVTSSPRLCSTRHQEHSCHSDPTQNRSGKYLRVCVTGLGARSAASDVSRGVEQNSIGNDPAAEDSAACAGAQPISMETRRAKRLRQILSESDIVNTSTPQQIYKKCCRLNSPVVRLELSQIPTLDVNAAEEQVSNEMDMLAVSIHNISLHDSLKELHSPVISGHVDSCHTHLSTSSFQPNSITNSNEESWQASASLFSHSRRSGSQLDSIIEEVTQEEDDFSICSEEKEENVDTPPSGYSAGYRTAEEYSTSQSYHTPATDDQFSEERVHALRLSFQKVQSPSLKTLSEKRVLKQLLRHNIHFWSSYRPDSEMEQFVKIGEGVYGEVYKFKHDGEVTVIKVVPMGGSCTVNDEPQKKLHEMSKEVEVTRKLSDVGHNFIHTKKIVYTQGVYPDILLSKWDDYAEKKCSENDRPDYFPAEQYYTVFEFADGGEALETYKFKNAAEGLSCLLQVGWCLAVAEDNCQFEHRDLHWGNILIAQENSERITYTFPSSKHRHSVSTSGVKVHIIDFTLSRLQNDNGVIFFDLSSDETLFQGYGDYQFDIYRQMKDVTSDEWRKFYSVTNILWMRYLADKLLKNKTFPSKRRCTPTVTQLKKSLLAFFERCEHYYSAIQMVLTDELFTEYSLDIGRQVSEGWHSHTSDVQPE